MLCIPKTISDKLRTAIKSGDIPLDKLFDMKSDETKALFSHYVGKESADFVNTEFEKAKLAATKKAAADYVTASEKESFARKATQGEFAKKLLNDQQKTKLDIQATDSKIKVIQGRQADISNKIKLAEGENKANLELKLQKLENQEKQLQVKKEDLQNPLKDRLTSKINNLKDILSPEEDKNFLSDIVKSKMGQDVSPAQGKYIVEQAEKLQELKNKGTDQLSGISPEYDTIRNDLQNYINNLNPQPRGASIISNLIQIARNNLITNVSTPLKTFESGVINQTRDKIVRRIASGTFSGSDGELANQIEKENFSKFAKTGISDAVRTSVDDVGAIFGTKKATGNALSESSQTQESFGQKAGKVVGKVEGAIQKAADISNKIAIQIEHNIPFTKIYGKAFADTLNVRSLDFAKLEGLKGAEAKARGAEMMRDAARVEPETQEGRILRAEGQQAAARVLNVNDTYASRVAVGLKNAVNKAIPGVPIGDLIEPIAKIPANIIANGIDNTPIGLARELPQVWDAVRGKHDLQSEDLETRYKGLIEYRNGLEHLTRVIGSVAVAAIVVSNMKKSDFRSDQYGNHFVKFGDTWVNTEYFAFISPNIAGMMAVKMNPKENTVKAFLVGKHVGEGALGGLIHTPGINELYSSIKSGLGGTGVTDFGKQAKGRAVPAIIQNMFKDRPVDRIFFGAEGVESDKQYRKDGATQEAKATATRAANKAAKAK